MTRKENSTIRYLFSLSEARSLVSPIRNKNDMVWELVWRSQKKQITGKKWAKKHWKKCIPSITRKDLNRTITAFLGVVQYVQMNNAELHIIPKTMCQDDVKRNICPYKEQGYQEATQQLCSFSIFHFSWNWTSPSEMKDLQGNCGSYELAALTNLIALPLSKKNLPLGEAKTYFNEKEGWKLYASQLSSKSAIENRWEFNETSHNAAEQEQLSRHVKQTVEYINGFSPITILRTFQPISTVLHAKANHHHVLLFGRKIDFFLRTSFLLETGLLFHVRKH